MPNEFSKPTVLLIIFFMLSLPCPLYGQESEGNTPSDKSSEKEETAYLRQQLDLARKYKEEGDYLWAARLVNYVVDESKDGDLTAESLFELINIGDLVAERFNSRNNTRGLRPSAQSQGADVWQEQFYTIMQEDIKLFSEEAISIRSNHWGIGFHFDPTKILTKISESYPDTEWGESAYARLIIGIYGADADQAHRFLERYPESERKPWIYTVLGNIYTDDFNYGSDCDAESEYGKASMDNAVKYYLLAKEAYLEKEDDKRAQNVSEAAQDLIDGKCPDFLYYLVD